MSDTEILAVRVLERNFLAAERQMARRTPEEVAVAIVDAERQFLTKLIDAYKQANFVFSKNRDMILSNKCAWETPFESTLVSLTYFSARAALRYACSTVTCPLARRYSDCSESAQECPKLVLAGNSDEAAARMQRLDEAQRVLFQKYRS